MPPAAAVASPLPCAPARPPAVPSPPPPPARRPLRATSLKRGWRTRASSGSPPTCSPTTTCCAVRPAGLRADGRPVRARGVPSPGGGVEGGMCYHDLLCGEALWKEGRAGCLDPAAPLLGGCVECGGGGGARAGGGPEVGVCSALQCCSPCSREGHAKAGGRCSAARLVQGRGARCARGGQAYGATGRKNHRPGLGRRRLGSPPSHLGHLLALPPAHPPPPSSFAYPQPHCLPRPASPALLPLVQAGATSTTRVR